MPTEAAVGPPEAAVVPLEERAIHPRLNAFLVSLRNEHVLTETHVRILAERLWDRRNWNLLDEESARWQILAITPPRGTCVMMHQVIEDARTEVHDRFLGRHLLAFHNEMMFVLQDDPPRTRIFLEAVFAILLST